MRRWILRLGLLGLAALVVPACGGGGSSGTTTGSSGSGGGSIGTSDNGPAGLFGVAVRSLLSKMHGGRGLTLDGGSGGDFNVDATTGSDVRLLRSGTINSIVRPRILKPDLGVNPRIVAVSQTWTCDTGSGGMLQQFNNSIPGDGTANGGVATGLWIMPGVTLTIHPNFGGGGNTPKTNLQLSFQNSVYIQGTLRVGYEDSNTIGDQASDDAADFSLFANEGVVITSGGSIVLSGRTDSPGDSDLIGGDGGDLSIGSLGTIINAGIIDARGGAGEAGGPGGNVDLTAYFYDVFCTGVINASGGSGASSGSANIASISAPDSSGFQIYTLEGSAPTWIVPGQTVDVSGCTNGGNNGNLTVAAVSGSKVTLSNTGVAENNSPGVISLPGGFGDGGDGGSIDLSADDMVTGGGVFVTGSLISRGGNGAGGGGDGGDINLNSDAGAVTSSGTLDSSGGDGLGSAPGGDANSIDLNANGTLRVTGTLRARGGNGAGTSITGGSDGGDGDDINLNSNSSGAIVNQALTGGVAIGATLDTGGGDGAMGGDAGNVNINASSAGSIVPGQDTVWILGYSEISTAGGDALLDAGNAGDIDIFNGNRNSGGIDFQGSIHNEVPFSAIGGTGTRGRGGAGGLVDIVTEDGGIDTGRSVTNLARIDVSGGTGEISGTGPSGLMSDAGAVFMYDTFRIQNAGTIVADGGAATSFGQGGDGGGIQLISDDVVVSTASFSANGANGANFNGGWGGAILLQGRRVATTGTHNADGANGGTNPGNLGGWGGLIEVYSSETLSAVTGTLTVRPGTGEAIVGTGLPGLVKIDGVTRVLTNGTITLP